MLGRMLLYVCMFIIASILLIVAGLLKEGFSEVLNSQGRLLQTPLYRTIRQTRWVISFEQARAWHAYTEGQYK